MKFIKNTFKKLFGSRKAKLVVASVLTMAALSGVAFAGWTPTDRHVFDYSKPCVQNDNDPYDRCGSMNGPVFNSFVNTPYYGDERAFFDASRTDQATQPGAFKDVLPHVADADGSREVILRTYIHNNASQTTNDSGVGIAHDAKVQITLPTGTERALRARSYITWSNPAPGWEGEVTDTAEMTDGDKFSIQYIPGSAKIYNAAHVVGNGGLTLPDSIVTTGAAIGYDQMNGNFPGCFDYKAMVEIRVKIVVPPKPQISIEKEVRQARTDDSQPQAPWGEMAEVKPGDKVQWLIGIENKGDSNLDHVAVSDQLPPHLSLVPGSVRYIDAAQDVVQGDHPLFTTGGIDTIVPWQPGGGFYVRFDTMALDDFTGCEVTLRNIGFVKSTQTPNEEQDNADVKITKENCNPVTPVYSCDLLEVTPATADGAKTFNYTVNYTATNGATFKNARFTFGDNSQPLLTNQTTVQHTYQNPGDYATQVHVTFTVDGQDHTVTSADCAKTITVTAPPVFTCDALEFAPVGGRTYQFRVRYTATNGATLKRVVYGADNGANPIYVANNANPVEHTFATGGTHFVAVALVFEVNGEEKVVEDNKCTAQIEVPEYRCDDLTARSLGERQFRFGTRYTANNGATFKSVSYNFGDGQTVSQTTNANINHTYARAGNYTVQATLTFDVNGEDQVVTDGNCVTHIVATTPRNNCPLPGKTHLPANSPECKEVKNCLIPGKTHLPANSPECVIVNTGMGELFGLFAATSVAGAAAHYVFSIRRLFTRGL